MSLHPSSIQTLTVGPGVPPDHAYLVILSGCEGSARGLYHRSGIHGAVAPRHPAPKVFIWLSKLYPWLRFTTTGIQLCFDDAIDRADAHALG